MSTDEDFKPKLGRLRSGGSKRGQRYLQRVLRSMSLAGGIHIGRSAQRQSFQGNRIGRGAGVGRVLSTRDQYAGYRQRRVIVKSRIVKLAGKSRDAARAHLRYIQRDGVTRDGQPGQLYSAEHDRADAKAFLDRGAGDRHRFRFIISAEDAVDYDDLKLLVRRLMSQMEEDLGTRLDWVAVDHYNTGHPHSHVILRGRTDRDKDLIIARSYMTEGIRERASEIVGFDLGPRSDREVEERLLKEVDQERFTTIDRNLLRDQDSQGLVQTVANNPLQQTLRAGRLQKLRRLGLAEDAGAGEWRLSPELEETLRRMDERGDIIKAIHRDLAEKKLERAAVDYRIYDPDLADTRPVVGRLVRRGLSDEINDRHYLMIDGVDGQVHYVDIGRGESVGALADGSVLAITPKSIEPRPVDRTIADIAVANGGRYNRTIHLLHDPAASPAFVEAHIRRLEAIRRAVGSVERELDGTWKIGVDHLDRVVAYERQLAKNAPVLIEVLSVLPIEQQIGADGATWLDKELLAKELIPLRDGGYGDEVKQALISRRQWLIDQGVAREEGGRTLYLANMQQILRRREMVRISSQLSTELGLNYVESQPGDRVDGIYRRSIQLMSGKVALIEKSREFTLVPWRPVFDRQIGKSVSGIMRSDTVSWSFSRQRGGPSIS